MMLRYKKVVNDLRTDIGKNLLLVVAIAIGVYGVGTILGGYAVLKREMATNYLGTNPASATIKLDGPTSISRALVDQIENFPGIETAERHGTIHARMKIGADWLPLLLFVRDDFQNLRTNKVAHISGKQTPPTGTMLVERTAYRVLKCPEGGRITIKTPNGKATAMTLSGTVHDPSLAPAWQEPTGYGYITQATLNKLGERRRFDELRIVVSNPDATLTKISEKATSIAGWLEQNGYRIREIQVPPPKRHPHQGQMNATLTLFAVFGFMVLLLSCILVASAISTLMVKQVRQIGIMKTIGGTSRQISGLYFIMILLISVVAVVAVMPLSHFSATIFYTKIATMLNIRIFDPTIPDRILLIQILSGIVIPLLAVAIPVLKGSRITVREAMDNFSVANRNFGRGYLHGFLARFTFFNGVYTLCLRNVFRKRSRLIMSLCLLAAGGAMFMTSLNVSKSWDQNLQKIYMYRHYDLEIRLHGHIDPTALLKKLKAISGVKDVEAWNYAPTVLNDDNQFEIVNTYPDTDHGSFLLLALPVSTRLLDLPLQQGKWLSDPNAREVVLNQIFRARMPGIQIGDVISLSAYHRPGRWRVAGFVEDVGSPATAFVPITKFDDYLKTDNSSNMLRISYNDRSASHARRLTRKIETLLSREEISVDRSIPVSSLHNAVAEHMQVLVGALFFMAVLMALIGAICLMLSMSMNVMERTREIGVLRAIGATPKKIHRLVIGEGLITGVISIFMAVALSLPISFFIGQLIGDLAFRTPLPLNISYPAIVVWIMIIIIGSIAATLLPARCAVGITTRGALAYE